jgi:hypothetical protein
MPPDRAEREVKAFADWVSRLGTAEIESEYGQKMFRYDVKIRFSPARKSNPLAKRQTAGRP